MVPARDGESDDQVALAGEPVEQRLHRRDQQHEQASPAPARQLVQLARQLGRHREGARAATVGLDRRSREIRRQVQHRQFAGKARPPVVAVRRHPIRGQPRVLPRGVIAVMQAQRRQFRLRAARAAPRRQPDELAHEDAQTPVVGDDMVGVEEEDVPVGAEPQQGRAQQGAAFQIEFGGGVRPGAGPGRGLRVGFPGQVRLLQPGERDGMHPLARLAANHDKGGAERFVAPGQAGQSPVERVGIDGAFEQERRGHVVGGGRSLHLGQNPEAQLGVGQGVMLAIRSFGQRLIARAPLAVDLARQFGHGRTVEHLAQRHLDPEFLLDAADHLGRLEAVAAQVEENSPARSPARGPSTACSRSSAAEFLLHSRRGAARRISSAAAISDRGRGQRLAVDLAVGQQRHRLQHREVRRHHVDRQALAEEAAQSRRQFPRQLLVEGIVGRSVAPGAGDASRRAAKRFDRRRRDVSPGPAAAGIRRRSCRSAASSRPGRVWTRRSPCSAPSARRSSGLLRARAGSSALERGARNPPTALAARRRFSSQARACASSRCTRHWAYHAARAPRLRRAYGGEPPRRRSAEPEQRAVAASRSIPSWQARAPCAAASPQPREGGGGRAGVQRHVAAEAGHLVVEGSPLRADLDPGDPGKACVRRAAEERRVDRHLLLALQRRAHAAPQAGGIEFRRLE